MYTFCFHCRPFVFIVGPLEPRGIEIFNKKSDKLGVRWEPSECADAFKVEFYHVKYRELLRTISQNASIPSTEKKDTYSFLIQDLEPKTIYMISVGAENRRGTTFNEETAYETLVPRKLLDYIIIIQTLHVSATLFFQTCLVNFFWRIIFVSVQKHWPRNKSMCCLLTLKPCSTPMGHFRVPPGPCIKTRLSAQPLIQN